MAIKVFCCYAREDEAFLNKLRTYLKPLQRKGLIEIWYDGEISAGTRWETEIHEQLNMAQIILLLVSPHFIDSDYCYGVEMVEAVKRHERYEACVIPVILSPVHWQETPFGQLQALPKNAKPLTNWRNKDEAIFNIADGIKKVVYELSSNSDAISETRSKPALSPNDADPDPPLIEEKSPIEQDDIEERISDSDKHRNKSFEEQKILASQLLENHHPLKALEILSKVSIEQLPAFFHWQLSTLRGQCYFSMKEFQSAQREFLHALDTLPQTASEKRYPEVIILHFHLAATSRELGYFELAYEQFQDTLALINISTPFRYIVEAHWGFSLVLYERSYKLWNNIEDANWQDQEAKKAFLSSMQQSRTYAEKAYTLYNAINELARSALMNCQIALIEQAMENLDAARIRLKKVLDEWAPTLDETGPDISPEIVEKIKRYSLKERANIVSAAACYLANVEFDAKQCDTALKYIDTALKAGEASYILRRADAFMTKGQILAACNDAGASFAFRQALKELERTDRLGAKIRVHRMLGAYLIKMGMDKEGNAELDKALRLANIPSTYTTANTDDGF